MCEGLAKAEGGLQLLVGLDFNGEWVKRMKNYSDELIKNSPLLAYPTFPLVQGKRIRTQANMVTGETYVIFETQNWESLRLQLTKVEFEAFQSKHDQIQEFITAVQQEDTIPQGHTLILTEEGGWQSTTLYIMNSITVKIKWQASKRHTLISLVDKDRYFTMSAGAFLYLRCFLNTKLTNALRMWHNILSSTCILRPALLSDFQPELNLMTPYFKMEEPIEIEDFNGLSLSD